MIHHIWSVLCRTSIVNAQTNSITLSDVMEFIAINAVVDPATDLEKTDTFSFPIDYEVTALLARDDASHAEAAELLIKQNDPKHKLLMETTQAFTMPIGMSRIRLRLQIHGVTVSTTGKYNFEIGLKQPGQAHAALVASVPLEVQLNLQEQ